MRGLDGAEKRTCLSTAASKIVFECQRGYGHSEANLQMSETWHFRVTLRSLWIHFAHEGVTLKSLWVNGGYFGVTLVIFQRAVISQIDLNDFMQL